MGSILKMLIALLWFFIAINGNWIASSQLVPRSGAFWNPRVVVRSPPENTPPKNTSPENTPVFDMRTKQQEALAQILKPKIHSRVIGGESTTIEKLGGYLVALRYKNEFICGGTLIEPRFVISAAHCFLGRTMKTLWTVEGGITTLTDTGVRAQLKDYVVPSVFKEKNMHMDVAILLLETPLIGYNIAPAIMCRRSLDEGLLLTVSGWGLVDIRASSPFQILQTVTVPVVSKSECSESYKKSMRLTKSMFCAGVLGTKDACTFDSGGPLVYEDPYGGPKELCGIVSFGVSCASPKFAGVYTDVNYVKPFIMQTIQSFKESSLY